MNPFKYAEMIKYLTRAKKANPNLPDVFPASKAPIPAKTQNVEEIEAINRFNRDNPRKDMANGGSLKFYPKASGGETKQQIAPGVDLKTRDINYGGTLGYEGDKVYGGVEYNTGKVKFDITDTEGNTLFKDTLSKDDAVNFIVGLGDRKGDKFQIKTDKDFTNMQVTFRESRDKLFDLNSQQRVEMLVVQNKVNETKRNLEFVKQDAKLTQSELNNEIANRNLVILGVLSSVLIIGYFYSRYVHKRELTLANESRAKIAEKEQKLSLALWASGDVLWSWDIDAQKVSRENVSELNALPCGNVDPNWENLKAHVHAEDFHILTERLDAIKNNQEDAFDVSYRVKNKAGEWAWVQDKGKVVKRDQQGRPQTVSGIQHDITILKQQEADLVVLNTELEQRVQQRTHDLVMALDDLKATQQNLVEAEKMAALGSLVAGLAHEVNTPLGTVIMAVTHLHAELQQIEDKVERGALSKQDLITSLRVLGDSADLVFNGAKRTSALVEQFKRVSVSHKGEGRAVCKFDELVKTAYRTVHDALGHPENVTLLDAPPFEISTYIDPLLQVIELLISNAIQHGEPNEPVTISVQMKNFPEYYEVTVEDDGVGIAEHERTKVFDPFYTLARHKGHVGLGLNITFNLVSQVLEGTIRCEQSELGGAKFVFSIKKETTKILA